MFTLAKSRLAHWSFIFAVGLLLGSGLGWMGSSITLNLSSENLGPTIEEAVVMIDAFHWGWVPNVLEPGAGVEAIVSMGGQGSEIHIPQGTRVKLILRNAGGNAQSHEIFEERFSEYFLGKYGEVWDTIHAAGHEGIGMVGEDEHDESEELHIDTNQPEPPSSVTMANDPMMNHSFFLEGYNLQVNLPNDPENNVQFLEFTADKPGEFRFMCANFCGVGHDAMGGKLIIKPT